MFDKLKEKHSRTLGSILKEEEKELPRVSLKKLAMLQDKKIFD